MTHHYAATARWSGSTAEGYDHYDRAHEVTCPPAAVALRMSGDPAFLGDAALLNPEQLLLAAAMSCQLLSFLAVAARARIDVVAYADDGSAVMPEDEEWVTAMTLRPRITVRSGPSEERVLHLVEVAHRQCYIARSVRSEIRVEATVDWVATADQPG